jgi:hypothetical protein
MPTWSSMETKNITFDGVPLIVPVISGALMEFLQDTFKGYPSKCGAGEGIGDKIVPETVFGLPISPVCHIHDTMFDIAEATWQDFHQANSVFLHNILSTIRHKSNNSVMEHIRNYRAVTFYNAVDTIGGSVFWDLKAEGYNA